MRAGGQSCVPRHAPHSRVNEATSMTPGPFHVDLRRRPCFRVFITDGDEDPRPLRTRVKRGCARCSAAQRSSRLGGSALSRRRPWVVSSMSSKPRRDRNRNHHHHHPGPTTHRSPPTSMTTPLPEPTSDSRLSGRLAASWLPSPVRLNTRDPASPVSTVDVS